MQDEKLKQLWDRYGGKPGALERITCALDAGVAKSAVAVRLRHLGLKRGVLTEAQVLPNTALQYLNASAPHVAPRLIADPVLPSRRLRCDRLYRHPLLLSA